jgi:hypothetical protein
MKFIGAILLLLAGALVIGGIVVIRDGIAPGYIGAFVLPGPGVAGFLSIGRSSGVTLLRPSAGRCSSY